MASSVYLVRRASVGDAARLRAIRLESLLDTPEAFGVTYEDASTWSMRRWRTVAAQWNFYLGERNDTVVGMISGGFNDQHPATCWMYGMYVTPDARGTGLASALVDAVAEWARDEGTSELYLHVTETVVRARAFYQKIGFAATGDSMTMGRDPSIRLMTMVRRLD